MNRTDDPGSISQTTDVSSSHLVTDPMKKSSAAMVTFSYALAILCKAAFVVSCLMQLELLQRAPVPLAEAQANDARQQAMLWISTPSALLALILLFVWLYRTKKKAIQAGMQDVVYTPGFSVGCFFLPIFNFFLPFSAMNELWKGSVNPGAWKEQRTSALVVIWWCAWLVITAIPLALLAYAAPDLESLKIQTVMLAINGVLSIGCYTFTILVTHRISAQLNRFVAEVPDLPDLNLEPVP